jgi:hypothetical protein
VESYTFDLGILQRPETVVLKKEDLELQLDHLFLLCNFAKACWASSVGVTVLTPRPVLQTFRRVEQQLGARAKGRSG